MAKTVIAVIYGGRSTEHEVSLQSAENLGNAALAAMPESEIVPVLITREGRWFVTKACGSAASDGPEVTLVSGGVLRALNGGYTKKIDLAIPAIHGAGGEDGTLQGLLEMADVPYTGCGVMASSVGIDKVLCKELARLNGLPVLDQILLERGDKNAAAKAKASAAKMGYPVFVKPVSLGSSVGVTRVSCDAELEPAIAAAFRFDTRVMVEKGVDHAREVVCGVLGAEETARPSICGEIRPKKHEFYDYEAKYNDPDGFDFVLPAEMPDSMSADMRDMSVRFFRAIKGRGLARIDFLLDKAGKNFYFCEINTMPGFTSHSLYPKLWENTGLSAPEVVRELIALALAAGKTKDSLKIDL